MIQINELREGNIIARRSSINIQIVVDVEILKKVKRIPWLFVGIPITQAELEKFGFELKDAGDFGHYYSLEDFDLNQDYQPIDFDCDEIKYVHQLQNVYFIIKGKELI